MNSYSNPSATSTGAADHTAPAVLPGSFRVSETAPSTTFAVPTRRTFEFESKSPNSNTGSIDADAESLVVSFDASSELSNEPKIRRSAKTVIPAMIHRPLPLEDFFFAGAVGGAG
jgi:hypothetical protein